jgi:hypothetical protein
MHFHILENNFKSQHLSWKCQKWRWKKINFNILNEYGDEWDNLQKYTPKNKINGW